MELAHTFSLHHCSLMVLMGQTRTQENPNASLIATVSAHTGKIITLKNIYMTLWHVSTLSEQMSSSNFFLTLKMFPGKFMKQ